MEWETMRLVKRARKGDAQAFSQLILNQEKMLSRVAMTILKDPEDAADAVQDAILNAWQGVSSLREPGYFRTWLVRILIRSCYRTGAARSKNIHVQLEEFLCSQDPPDWDQSLDIRATLERLRPEDRLLLGLFYYDGLSIKGIARALDLSEDCVKQRLHRGRKRFRADFLGKEVLSREK